MLQSSNSQDVEGAMPRASESRRRPLHEESSMKYSEHEENRTVEPPRSRGLPLTTSEIHNGKNAPDPALLHPILCKVPLHLRFGVNGVISSLLFMITYNWAVTFEKLAPSTWYAIIYLIFIPIGHAMASLLVFGWPERYLPSLMSNFPIGLSSIVIGGALTAYLDQIAFNDQIIDIVRDYFTFSQMPLRARPIEHEQGEFYSSLVVLFVTSVWTYVLSVYINSPPTKSEKKEA